MSAGQDFADQVADPTTRTTWADDPRYTFTRPQPSDQPEQGDTGSE